MDKSRIKDNIKTTAEKVEKQRKSPGVYTSEIDDTYTGELNKSDKLFKSKNKIAKEEEISDKIIINMNSDETTT